MNWLSRRTAPAR